MPIKILILSTLLIFSFHITQAEEYGPDLKSWYEENYELDIARWKVYSEMLDKRSGINLFKDKWRDYIQENKSILDKAFAELSNKNSSENIKKKLNYMQKLFNLNYLKFKEAWRILKETPEIESEDVKENI